MDSDAEGGKNNRREDGLAEKPTRIMRHNLFQGPVDR